MEMILSSNPAKRVYPFLIKTGSKLDSLSRGTSMDISPSSVLSVLEDEPLRLLFAASLACLG